MAASAAEQVQVARTRARRRLIGAVVLLGVGIVGFPLLFETQPRPLPVDVTIEIPRKDGGVPLVLPPRVTPITESAEDVGREVPPPVAAASASAPVAAPVRPVTPAAASTPQPSASAPRVAAGASQAAEGTAPAQLPPPIKVLPDTPAAERRPAATVARETPPAREPQREAPRDKPPVKEATKEAARDTARETTRDMAKDKEPAREVARDKPAVKEAAREPARDKDPIRELVKDKEKDKDTDRADAAVEKRYIVQVGAFADAAAASEARARVEKLGIRSYTQEIQTDAGRRIRVRVGPFASREEADKALGKLRAAGLATALLPQP